MRKTLLAIAALASLAFAGAASAGTLSGEVDFGRPQSTDYNVSYTDTIKTHIVGINYGLLAEVQPASKGPLTANLSIQAGPALPAILGFQPAVYAEVGDHITADVRNVTIHNVATVAQTSQNESFWGAGVDVSHKIWGPVSADVGYRPRQGFSNANLLREDRAAGGLDLALDSRGTDTLGVVYYKTWGTTVSDQVGVILSHRF